MPPFFTVSDEGEPYFERGCALENICELGDYENTILEYCHTCSKKYCNNDFMSLDQEVEQYLQDQLTYTTEKTTALPTTTHSSEWYLKKHHRHNAILKMRPTLKPSSTNRVPIQTTINSALDHQATESRQELLPEIYVQRMTTEVDITSTTYSQETENTNGVDATESSVVTEPDSGKSAETSAFAETTQWSTTF